MGRMKVVHAFPLPGRGFVVAGEVAEGVCRADDILIHSSGAEFPVRSVEMLDVSISQGIAYPALVLEMEAVQDRGLAHPNGWLGQEIRTEQRGE